MQISQALSVTLHDYHPRADDMRTEVLRGLHDEPKTLPCKYFYDERGSALFDAICELPEYYLTRTELAILETHVDDMVAALGPDVLLVEPGSGSSLKTRLLLEHLRHPAAYVPVDISRTHLVGSADRLNRQYPDLEVIPVCADFNRPFDLPKTGRRARRTVVYFPGSTLGNFEPPAAIGLLRHLRRLAGEQGALLVGVDLRKSQAVLERAYNDSAGVTAEFNLNLLRRLNRELAGNFELSRFGHHAVYDAGEGRIEMRLVSKGDQVVSVAGEEFGFRDGEFILTEYSYKHTLDGFARLAGRAGLAVRRVWTDDRRYFSVQLLEPST